MIVEIPDVFASFLKIEYIFNEILGLLLLQLLLGTRIFCLHISILLKNNFVFKVQIFFFATNAVDSRNLLPIPLSPPIPSQSSPNPPHPSQSPFRPEDRRPQAQLAQAPLLEPP